MVGNLAVQHSFSSEIEITKVSTNELKWCTVTLSDVIKANKRLEASVFEVDCRHARDLVKHCKYTSVPLCGENGLVTAYTCGRFKRIWVNHSDLPIFQPSTIMDISPQPDGYISHLTNTDINKLRVKKGQVLLTCSGTVGRVALVSKTLDNQIFSHDLIRIDAKEHNDIGYIYAFLKSAVGNKLLQSNGYGAVITHIEAEHLAEVPIPNPSENIKMKINHLIIRSFELRDESNELLDKATALLIKELQLPSIHEFEIETQKKDSTVNTFSVKLSKLSGRTDASYHLPIVKAITNHMEKYAAEVTTVGDARISKRIVLAGVFKRVYVEKGYGIPFLGGREISQLNPQVEKFLSKPHHKVRYEKELKVKENMILITDRGTVGEVALVPKHFENWAVSQNVLKLEPANNDISGYAFVFLNSVYGNLLIKHHTYGSVIDMIDDNSMSNVVFPLLRDVDIQKQINDFALNANEKRYEAYKLEQSAMDILNNEVIYAK